jgi:tRNA G18 (ribose-2'-O)-methylase SpoU
MKEFIYGRNPVYETLRAHRRDVFRLEVAEGAQDKGRLTEILDLSAKRKIPVERVPRARLDKLSDNHQGVALEASAYPYMEIEDILDNAMVHNETPWNHHSNCRSGGGAWGAHSPSPGCRNYPVGGLLFGGCMRTYARG